MLKKHHQDLSWDIDTSDESFYPGQAIPLILRISNNGTGERSVFFGRGGIEAFSISIRDVNGTLITNSDRLQPSGFSESGICRIATGSFSQKSIVLNRWCSTLLMPGEYKVVCDIGYWLISEVENHKLGPVHSISLELDIEIKPFDESGFRKKLEKLTEDVFESKIKTRNDWNKKVLYEKMLALTESHLAIPHQLKLLKTTGTTWLKKDTITSLVLSESVEAAEGLAHMVESSERFNARDVKSYAVAAVYALRESGKSDILSATDDFVLKYPYPWRRASID